MTDNFFLSFFFVLQAQYVAVAAVMLHFTPYIWEFRDTDISVCVCVCGVCVCVYALLPLYYMHISGSFKTPIYRCWEFQGTDISVQVACSLKLLVYAALSY